MRRERVAITTCFKKLMDVANGEGEGSCKSVVPSGSSDLMSGIVNRN